MTEEDTQVAGEHMRRCYMAHGSREMQTKAAVRSHRAPVPTAQMGNRDNTKRWRGHGATGTPRLVPVGAQNGAATAEDSLGVSYKSKDALTQ